VSQHLTELRLMAVDPEVATTRRDAAAWAVQAIDAALLLYLEAKRWGGHPDLTAAARAFAQALGPADGGRGDV
jgi:hypothetical protein